MSFFRWCQLGGMRSRGPVVEPGHESVDSKIEEKVDTKPVEEPPPEVKPAPNPEVAVQPPPPKEVQQETPAPRQESPALIATGARGDCRARGFEIYVLARPVRRWRRKWL